jgi:hypothetical protein
MRGRIQKHLNDAMPPATQAAGVAMDVRSGLEVDPAALAHEMISLLRRVRVPVVR